MKIPVVGPSYKLEAEGHDAQDCVNLYPEISESRTSKEITRLVGTPGLELFTTAGSGPIRGSFTTAGGRNFHVSGNTLYEIDTAGTATSRGTLNTSVGRVSITENGTQMGLVDGTNGYIFTLATNSLDQIVDADFPNGATVIIYQDTYFIVNDPDTGDFYISDNNDGTSWAALDKTTVESSPDNLVSLLSDHGELFCFGDKTTEVYYNKSLSDPTGFPFGRISQAIIQTGCAAAQTPKSFDNAVVWLGTDERGRRVVWQSTENYRTLRISSIALECALAELDDISDAYAWTYFQEGHEFYVLQVPGIDRTWVYDAATKLWHNRMYYDAVLNEEKMHRGATHTYFNGFNLIGDRESGKIYKLKLNHYSDNGDEIHRIRVTPPVHNEMKQVAYHALHLDMEPGVGLQSGQGDDPQVMMRYSDDGGHTWSNERWAPIGKVGQYRNRARWTRLGMGRVRNFEFRITDPVQVSISGAYADISLGAH